MVEREKWCSTFFEWSEKREMKSIRLNKCCRMSIWIVCVCVLCAEHADPHREFNSNFLLFLFVELKWEEHDLFAKFRSCSSSTMWSLNSLSYTTCWANIYQRILTLPSNIGICQLPLIKFCLLLTNAVRSIDSRIQLFLASIWFWLVSHPIDGSRTRIISLFDWNWSGVCVCVWCTETDRVIASLFIFATHVENAAAR